MSKVLILGRFSPTQKRDQTRNGDKIYYFIALRTSPTKAISYKCLINVRVIKVTEGHERRQSKDRNQEGIVSWREIIMKQTTTILFLICFYTQQRLSTHAAQTSHPSTLRLLSNTCLYSRRIVFQSFLTVLPLLRASAAAATITTNCNDGRIIAESAVPGAYQQVCMTLELREIPLHTISTNIYIQQGQVAAGRTGVAVWNSALLLVRSMDFITMKDPSWLHGKTVLELGCGTGVTSIAMQKLGASHVIATDGNPNVLELAKTNVERNNISNAVKVSELQWGLMNAIDYSDTADIVIGSDLTYNSGTWRVLSETISTVLKPGGIAIYLSLGHGGFNVNGEVNGFLQVIEGLKLVGDTSSPRILPVSSLQRLLDSIITLEEKVVLDATGGAKVIVLQKPVN